MIFAYLSKIPKFYSKIFLFVYSKLVLNIETTFLQLPYELIGFDDREERQDDGGMG